MIFHQTIAKQKQCPLLHLTEGNKGALFGVVIATKGAKLENFIPLLLVQKKSFDPVLGLHPDGMRSGSIFATLLLLVGKCSHDTFVAQICIKFAQDNTRLS